MTRGGCTIDGVFDDFMHTALSVLEDMWGALLWHGSPIEVEVLPLINRRCNLYPFSKNQETIRKIGTELPGKARNRLTSLVPLLFLVRGMFSKSPCSLCKVNRL